jgi:hypothetical protein
MSRLSLSGATLANPLERFRTMVSRSQATPPSDHRRYQRYDTKHKEH